MVVPKIRFPTVWENNPGIENQNIDVFVELENGYNYVLVVATAKNLEFLMDDDKINYLRAGHPFLIVKEFTKKIIEEAVQAYAEENDGYWLKWYHFIGEINKTVFNDLQAKHMKKLSDEKLNKLDELNNS